MKNSKNLKLIALERIQDELNKILVSDFAAEGIELLRELKLLQHIHSGARKRIWRRTEPASYIFHLGTFDLVAQKLSVGEIGSALGDTSSRHCQTRNETRRGCLFNFL